MFLHPEFASQLIRDRERQMLADASQRRLLHHPAPAKSPTPASRIMHRLAMAIARARAVAAGASGAIRPAERH